MLSLSQQQQQFDHAAWRDALRGWREDTARWRADHEYLLGRLADLQSAIEDHGRPPPAGKDRN
jgi:hypothetical protein